MKKYRDYQKKGKKLPELTKEELSRVDWTQYKIVVPREVDKQELMDTFEHFHDEGYDPDLVTANQVAHEYIGGTSIIVDEELFAKLEKIHVESQEDK